MIPPEIVALFRDWPQGLLLVVLASPFLVLLGVLVKAIFDRYSSSESNKVSMKEAEITEMEAETHQFTAVIDGFSKALEAVNKRAADAEAAAKEAKAEAKEAKEESDGLAARVKTLEDERQDAIMHVGKLEGMVPNPPGPPDRPVWMRKS